MKFLVLIEENKEAITQKIRENVEVDQKSAYVIYEWHQRKSVQTLGQLGNALCSEKLAPNSKVRIVWPRDRCKMLEEEVVLIDSPGIDVESDLDEWIDKFCLDSDVFVLVANAESTIMLTEKVRIFYFFYFFSLL